MSEPTNEQAKTVFIRRIVGCIRRALSKRGLGLYQKNASDGPIYRILNESGAVVYDNLDLNEARRIARDVYADWQKER